MAASNLSYVTLPSPKNVPPEQVTGLAYGIFGHLGSPVAYVVLLALLGVTAWNALWLFLATSVVFLGVTLYTEKASPSIQLPPPTKRELWDGLAMVFVKGVGVGGGFVAAGWWALSHVPLARVTGLGEGALSNDWVRITLATLGTDLAYYWIHRTMSHSRGPNPLLKYYRKKHAAHHSVTELDFMRGNQSSLVDTAISQFQPSLIVISWVLGQDLGGTLVAYGLILMLQATDHTSATFRIGWLNYVFMDNHAHKLHHCKRGGLINHAAAFAFWDRLWGTYYEDWSLSSNYLHHHGIPLPIKRAEPEPQLDAVAAVSLAP
jgi:sterol desaturase/sphingolipid hydroxylase (fatty acid hydroxylase superfamily)